MKKEESNKPHFKKFQIAKLNKPEFIIGGGDDDGTQSGDKGKKCILKSTAWVDYR